MQGHITLQAIAEYGINQGCFRADLISRKYPQGQMTAFEYTLKNYDKWLKEYQTGEALFKNEEKDQEKARQDDDWEKVNSPFSAT